MVTFQPYSKVLRSKDKTEIYADAVGDPSKQAIVFIHGFSLSGIVFDNIFADPNYIENFYLVCGFLNMYAAQFTVLSGEVRYSGAWSKR